MKSSSLKPSIDLGEDDSQFSNNDSNDEKSDSNDRQDEQTDDKSLTFSINHNHMNNHSIYSNLFEKKRQQQRK
jgi:hypothetical protein